MVLKHVHRYDDFEIKVSLFKGIQVRLWIGGEDADPRGSIDFNPIDARKLGKSLIEFADRVEEGG